MLFYKIEWNSKNNKSISQVAYVNKVLGNFGFSLHICGSWVKSITFFKSDKTNLGNKVQRPFSTLRLLSDPS